MLYCHNVLGKMEFSECFQWKLFKILAILYNVKHFLNKLKKLLLTLYGTNHICIVKSYSSCSYSSDNIS